ncbi:hypothetical protein KP509_18G046300 [Ceratopteris richardii]|uniref:VQ domain-containing protein n=1 Tax=Ceratopteris richardii TaxID=49495 RepID=A0A8T2SQU7_CERRI|nr:hypothetical protein KP509_18G046300 [Ceratopteris richardii]
MAPYQSSSPHRCCPHQSTPCPPSFFNLGVCAYSRSIAKPAFDGTSLLHSNSIRPSYPYKEISPSATTSQFHVLLERSSHLCDEEVDVKPSFNLNTGYVGRGHASPLEQLPKPKGLATIPSRLGVDDTTLREMKMPLFDVHSSGTALPSFNEQGSAPPQNFHSKTYDLKPNISSSISTESISGFQRFDRTSRSMIGAPPCRYAPNVRIVHIKAPKVVETDAANFRSIVQKLTGKSSKKTKKLKDLQRTEAESAEVGAPHHSSAVSTGLQTVKVQNFSELPHRRNGFSAPGTSTSEAYRKEATHAISNSFARQNTQEGIINSDKPMAITRVMEPVSDAIFLPSDESFSPQASSPIPISSLTSSSSPVSRNGEDSKSVASSASETTTILRWNSGSSFEIGDVCFEDPMESWSSDGKPKFTEWDIIWGLLSAVPAHELELPPLSGCSSSFEDTSTISESEDLWRVSREPGIIL